MRKARLAAVPLFLAVLGAVAGAEPVYGYFRQITGYLSSSYIDQTRFRDVRPLLQEALHALENSADDIMVEEAPDPSADGEGIVYTIRLDGETHTIAEREVAGGENPDENLRKLARVLERVMRFVESTYKGTAEEIDAVRYAMANGMCLVLDPHTNVFSPKEYKEFFVHIEGEIGGVGAYIGVRSGKLTIVSPLEGTPAQREGIRAEDEIVRIDDESTVSMTTQEAVARIRGAPGSEVVLWIRRKGHDGLIKKTLMRENVSIPSVRSRLLENGIGYIKVINFAQNTARSFLTQLNDLQKANRGALRGIVLDVRDNPGGLLDQAVALADAFLTRGDLVLKAEKGVVSPLARAENQGFEPRCPLVVLINQGAASGSEILAGALRNNDRALLVGRRTFGKGSVQQPRPLSDESCLKLTTYEYLLAGEVSIQNVGVTPDLALDPVIVEKDDLSVFADEPLASERLHKAAITSRFEKLEEPAWRFFYHVDLPDSPRDADAIAKSFVSSEFDVDGPDFVAVHLASRLILMADKDAPFSRTGFLAAHREDIQRLKEEKFREITAQLAAAGIDWTAGPVPPSPSYELAVAYEIITAPRAGGTPAAVEDGEFDLESDEDDPTPERKLRFTATLKNSGAADLWRVHCVTESDDVASFFRNREFLFGRVPAGGSVTRTLDVGIPYFSIPREEEVKVVVRADNAVTLGEKPVIVRIPEGPMPTFSAAVALRDKDGKEVRHVARGGEFTLRAVVRNTGVVEIFQAIARLKNETDPSQAVYLVRGRELLTELRPGEERVCEFVFRVADKAAADKYVLRLDVFESSSGKGLSKKFELRTGGGEGFVPVTLAPPEVAVKVDAFLTDRPAVRIEAVARDDKDLRAFMILTVTRDKRYIDGIPDKVFYRAIDGVRGPLTFMHEVPLRVGTNVVSVVATDGDKLKTVQTCVIKRR
ncbi:MAG TPA: S41 family peptidase [Planctomycetota bacterium]|nr:PDZ domain-containing protein [Planctomycetota bacterium]OQC20282.1 MAG: putative CtpA-like serine protease [Planctomycetes bacterium ADurb.Bin069]NMD36915.1 PDZ domain-containing protein [Planctomycetota bacterium]HNR99940.1 S41 family peptidase [Planctomycetota bacterium]HNU24830.1 S41 family peptidase [Planctomycetota bacterium]